MLEFLQIFSDRNFISPEHCYPWKPGLIGLHVASDVIIALSYFSIPLLFFYFFREQSTILSKEIFWLFSTFSIASSTTYLMAVWTLWHPNYWLSGLLKAISAGISFYTTCKLVHAMPQVLALKSNLTQQRSTNQALASEIEGLQQTEAELTSFTQHLSLPIEHIPLAVIQWTPNFEVVGWNPAAEGIFGYSKPEALGRHAVELIVPPDAREQVEQVAKQLLLQQIGTYSTHENLTKQGYKIYCEWYNTPFLDSEGQVIGITSLGQNITERKLAQEALLQAKNQLEIHIEQRTQELQQALAKRQEVVAQLQSEIEQRQQVETALREQEEQYRSVVASVKEVIFQTDANGFWRFLNPAWSEITGFAIAQSLGTLFLDYVHPDDRQRNLEHFQFLIEGKKKYCRHEVRYLTASGGYRWIEVFAQLTFDTDGNITGTCGTLYDITERHLSQVALCKRERYLAALVEVQRRLLAFKDSSHYELSNQTPYTEILELLGQVSGASRVYVFENHSDAEGNLLMSQRAEWCYPGIRPEIANPTLQNLSYDEFFPRWAQALSQDEIIAGLVADFPESERLVLKLQGILSILILPLTVNGKFFGFIGFDNCMEARPWEASEVDLLRAAAAAICLWTESFLAQKALRQSETTTRALLEAIPDTLVRISRDGTFLDFIPAKNVQRLICASEIVGKKVHEVLPVKWRRQIISDVNAALTTGKVQVSEAPFQLKDEQRHYEIRSVFYSEDEVLTIVRDVTARKRAEAARRKSEARLRKQHKALSELAQCPSIYNGNLRVALQEITKAVTRTLDVQRCSVWFYNKDHCSIHCADLYELTLNRHSAGYQRGAANYPNYFKILETERIIAASDAHNDPRTQEFSTSYLTPLGITSLLDVPIRLGGVTVGVLCIEHTGSNRQWALEEQNFVSTIAYMASLAMEASNHVIAEKALRESEERFRSLVAHIPGVVYRCSYDAHRTIEFISDFIAEISGYPAADFLHNQVRTFVSLIDPQDLVRVQQTISESVARRLPYVLEYRIIRADGSVRWVYEKGQGVFSAGNKLLWLDGVIFDTTGYRQTQEELRQSEEQFRQLTENIREVFFLTTPDLSEILYISPAYEQVWGRTTKSLYEQPSSWMDSVHPKDHDRVAAALAQHLQDNQDFEEEYRIVRPGGSVRWVWVRAFHVLNEAGVVTRLAGIAEDITEHKRAQAEILNALLQEKELSDLRSRFVSITSHEFRTPLTTIMSTAELLEYYDWTKEEEVEQLRLIQDSVKQMLQLLEDLLFIGTADAGQVRFNPAPIALNDFCRGLVAEIQRGASWQAGVMGTRHNFRFVGPAQTVLACMDKKLLRQLLSNLLANAVKYSPTGGTIQFQLDCQGDKAIFQIQDWGIGIPKEDLPRLFEFFHRGKNVGAIAGTGLGLAIVKKCVDIHEGDITVHSEVGVGTLFTVILPLNNPKAGQNQGTENGGSLPLSNP